MPAWLWKSPQCWPLVDSPLPLPCAVTTFPVRAAQLLRGIATAMSIDDFSVAVQWRPFAEAALQSIAPPKPTNGPRVHSWCV